MQACQGSARGHGLAGDSLAQPHCSSCPPRLLPPSHIQRRGHRPHCPPQTQAALGSGSGRGAWGGFPLQCEKSPPPHTALNGFKSHKAAEKNDGGRENEPRRKLSLTQGAARLSADREGRLAHKTKHLNSPLYNNYSALNASSPCPAGPGLLCQGHQEAPQGSRASREKGWSQCGHRSSKAS